VKGQSSAEILILVGGILITSASMVYLGQNSNESTVVTRAALDGAENAISALDLEYGCSIDIQEMKLEGGTISITVSIRDVPALDNFDNLVSENIRLSALGYIQNAISGSFSTTGEPIRTAYNTYDVSVDVLEVKK